MCGWFIQNIVVLPWDKAGYWSTHMYIEKLKCEDLKVLFRFDASLSILRIVKTCIITVVQMAFIGSYFHIRDTCLVSISLTLFSCGGTNILVHYLILHFILLSFLIVMWYSVAIYLFYWLALACTASSIHWSMLIILFNHCSQFMGLKRGRQLPCYFLQAPDLAL